ncbi:LAFE_0A00144g1_1 [Lachancea fermentati]|uniref:LAFE_0A00144g1_1 n=1 Tax=Lachancea fermentati TaxID=4955 RepID=A0A1G4M683_LACFM|nr:LAFE_0A00144g1_1 [Lachancea fermentati]
MTNTTINPEDGISHNLSTICIHGDDFLNRVPDVVTPINVSTTFRYDNENLVKAVDLANSVDDKKPLIYSRLSHPNAERLEAVLKSILGGPTVVYSSGLSAYFAILAHYRPRRIFMGHCYHGCKLAADLYAKMSGAEIHLLESINNFCEAGDLVHIEDPINPYGECVDLSNLSEITHERGGQMLVDSTLAPPPLRDPWKFGADIVMHSGTKYLGGHSDLLSGVVCLKNEISAQEMREERIALGTIPASLESFLLLRSLRTLEVRVKKQSFNCEQLVKYIYEHKSDFNSVLDKVHHASLQKEDFVRKQLPHGYGPLFSIVLKREKQCKQLVHMVRIFQHATSLGGAESLIEWRALSDPLADQTLIRISVGLENIEDLIEDLAGSLRKIQSLEI